ncbi:MAG: DUF4215 domain-containing protein [Deltaproteobacteria bacterium]|nr:DUF4215 domain-containing protein [Deltaproteobacteria bacterium]
MFQRFHQWTQGHIAVLQAWQRHGANTGAEQPRLQAIFQQLKALPNEIQTKWRRHCKATLWGVALCLAVSGYTPALANTITVDGTCTLVDAITSANTDTAVGDCGAGSGADTIVLTVDTTLTESNNSTYGDTGLPLIESKITIAGNGHTIMRDPMDPDQFRLIAIYTGDLTLQDTTLSGGKVRWGGGAIYNFLGRLHIEGCTISGNSANYGGGVYSRSGTLSLVNSTISGNSATNIGGGVVNGAYGTNTFSLVNSTVTGNATTSDRGGGVFSRSDGSSMVSVVNSTISGNSAGFYGGGMFTTTYDHSTVSVVNSVVTGNTTGNFTSGGGVFSRVRDYSMVSVVNSTIGGNSAAGYGGGVYSRIDSCGTLSLVNSTVTGNAAIVGGGIFGNTNGCSPDEAGVLSLVNSTVSGNTTRFGGGGGISSRTYSDGTFSLVNSTVTGNATDTSGGGMHSYVGGGGTEELHRSLITGNTAMISGDEVYRNGGGSFLVNDANLFGHSGITTADALYNVTAGATDLTATSDGTAPTALSAILDTALAHNGGPTQTHNLVSGSPALDAAGATCGLTTDQRGAPRPFDGDGVGGAACDIGAVEFGAPPPPFCGNTLTETPETCDDGNTISGDGCDNTCQSEGTPCGNGTVDTGEDCDEGAANGTTTSCCAANCTLQPNTTVCRTAAGDCDVAEHCPGSSPTCPSDTFQPPGTLCGSSDATSCDAPDTCNSSGACVDRVDPNGTQCVDGDACTVGDACTSGACSGPTPANCNDGNTCTDDGCTSPSGCIHVPNTEPCNDGLFCTVGDSCSGGACSGASARDCSSFDGQCRTGVCDELHDRCEGAPLPDHTSCDDGVVCTSNDQCVAGTCLGVPSACGDGVVSTTCSEQCDDGATVAGDGCSAECRLEPGWSCTGTPSVCTPQCGNGRVDNGEACDDGGTLPGDGCSAVCIAEPGWSCTGALSVCTQVCGDGIQTLGEECDDGNLVDGDGCESSCVLSPKTVSDTAVPGGTIRSDVEDDGATATDPLETAVTSPTGGAITITRQTTTDPAPPGFLLFDQQIVLSIPPSLPPNPPIMLVFTLDPVLGAGVTSGAVPIFKNGVLVPDCTGGPGVAMPDPCVVSRTLLANGEDLEVKVLTSTGSAWTFGLELCQPAPRSGCFQSTVPGKSVLKIVNLGSQHPENKLDWTWSYGEAVAPGSLGDPTVREGYAVCSYNAGVLVSATGAPAGGTCGSKACWKAIRHGYQLTDPNLTRGPVKLLSVLAGKAKTTRVQVNGRGTALKVPSVASLTGPVVTQLVNASGTCWESRFSAPFLLRTGSSFLDKAD